MRSSQPLSDEGARKRILEALDIEVSPTSEISDDLRTRILENLPSPDEIAAGKWRDDD